METSQQHRQEIWASNALYLSFAASLVTQYLVQSGYFATQKSVADILWLYAVNPIMLWVYYLIREGVYKAKTLYLALYGLVALQLCAVAVLGVVTDGLAGSEREMTLKIIGLVAEQSLKIGACVLILKSMRHASSTGIVT
jgi:hypothetical protein